MARRRLSCFLVLLLLSPLFLMSACSQNNKLATLPERLATKLTDLTSYQLTLQLEQTDGQQLTINQWYQSPDHLRTDVLQADEINYQFFLRGANLTMRHVPSGQQEQLRLAKENALFTAPLLFEIWQEAQGGSWHKSEERPASYWGEFSWRDHGGEPKLGSIWLNAQTLLPEEVSFFIGDAKVLLLRFEDIKLNPNLGEEIFQP